MDPTSSCNRAQTFHVCSMCSRAYWIRERLGLERIYSSISRITNRSVFFSIQCVGFRNATGIVSNNYIDYNLFWNAKQVGLDILAWFAKILIDWWNFEKALSCLLQTNKQTCRYNIREVVNANWIAFIISLEEANGKSCFSKLPSSLFFFKRKALLYS